MRWRSSLRTGPTACVRRCSSATSISTNCSRRITSSCNAWVSASAGGRTWGRSRSAYSASNSASLRSVLARSPRPLAKFRTQDGLTAATAIPAVHSAPSTWRCNPPVGFHHYQPRPKLTQPPHQALNPRAIVGQRHALTARTRRHDQLRLAHIDPNVHFLRHRPTPSWASYPSLSNAGSCLRHAPVNCSRYGPVTYRTPRPLLTPRLLPP